MLRLDRVLESQERRLRRSIDELSGDVRCSGAVLADRAPRWLPLASIGVASILAVAGPLLGLPIALVIPGMILAINAQAIFGPHVVIARTGPSVLLAEAGGFLPRARRVVAVAAAPVGSTETGGWLFKRMDLELDAPFDGPIAVHWTRRRRLLELLA
ncbi:MAG: hypothetical protein AAF547_20425 [Actinomycetota bacterium]